MDIEYSEKYNEFFDYLFEDYAGNILIQKKAITDICLTIDISDFCESVEEYFENLKEV